MLNKEKAYWRVAIFLRKKTNNFYAFEDQQEIQINKAKHVKIIPTTIRENHKQHIKMLMNY